jgi:hypothetical protein
MKQWTQIDILAALEKIGHIAVGEHPNRPATMLINPVAFVPGTVVIFIPTNREKWGEAIAGSIDEAMVKAFEIAERQRDER